MNFKFILIVLVFFLISGVSENMLFDELRIGNSTETKEKNDIRWLEEVRETETISSSTDNKTLETISSSGGNASAFFKTAQSIVKLQYFGTNGITAFQRATLHKTPKYIEYCTLKLDC
jgi:hypothetical protein